MFFFAFIAEDVEDLISALEMSPLSVSNDLMCSAVRSEYLPTIELNSSSIISGLDFNKSAMLRMTSVAEAALSFELESSLKYLFGDEKAA